MRIIEKQKKTIIEDIKDFDLKQSLECGQCFRYEELGEEEYLLVAKGKMVHVKQKDTTLQFSCVREEVEKIWIPYFDLDRDYGAIKQWLMEKDEKIGEAIKEKSGVRILNQDFFEMLITFIISQNKQIPHIMQIVERISQRYGEYIGEWNNKAYYSFPTPQQLSKASEADFLDMKAGFRAKYLVDACQKVLNGEIKEERLRSISYQEALEEIQVIKGVGEKVGNCVLLFGLGRREAFPIDVWMIRILDRLYFSKKGKKEQMQQFAKEHFGEYGGYAQQYLFYFARDNQVK
ncbi:DNA-3-methyladenine glycosylase family protein [Anaerosporobacter faecicola]|uniref:DNA-3-methyladenine glycosylase family protein n=1 Tax=Anaerosporobacter faecicola TaxID=2718714 RepID=UPI001EE5B335|nr:DNA glycosylase [Anaerosporobacter faecicola]